MGRLQRALAKVGNIHVLEALVCQRINVAQQYLFLCLLATKGKTIVSFIPAATEIYTNSKYYLKIRYFGVLPCEN